MDMLIENIKTHVSLSSADESVLQAMPHLMATIICAVFGIILLITKLQKKALQPVTNVITTD